MDDGRPAVSERMKEIVRATEEAGGYLDTLRFSTLRMANVARCEESYHPVAEWSYQDWFLALGEELGEIARVLKRVRRRGADATLTDAERRKLGNEAADLVIYLDLLCAREHVDLGDAVRRKFNEVSDERLHSKVRL